MGRARCRELIQFTELYIELPARRLYPEAFFGGKVSDDTKTEVGKLLDKGMRTIGQLAKFQPYIAGAEFTLADIVAAMHFPLAAGAVKVVLGRDLMEAIPGLKPYLKILGERPHFQTVQAARKADSEALAERRKAAAAAA
jgi:glutathione S-transferase